MENASGTTSVNETLYRRVAAGDVEAIDSVLQDVLVKSSPLNSLALYWRPLDVLTLATQADIAADLSWLPQRMRRSIWPWLLAECPQWDAQQLVKLPDALRPYDDTSENAVSSTLQQAAQSFDFVPLYDAANQPQGVLLLGAAGDLQPVSSQLLDSVRGLRKGLRDSLDANSGLLSAAAFVSSVDRWSRAATRAQTCLLECQINAVETTAHNAPGELSEGVTDASIPLQLSVSDQQLLEADLLALCQLRIRSRDICGKTGKGHFSIILKSCSIEDAERVAREIEASAVGYCLPALGNQVATFIQCRVHSFETRHASRQVRALVLQTKSQTTSAADDLSSTPALSTPSADSHQTVPDKVPSNVVHLPFSDDGSFAAIGVPVVPNDTSSTPSQDVEPGWRLLPGVAVDDNRRVECFRLAQFGAAGSQHSANVHDDRQRFLHVLQALKAMDSRLAVPTIMVDISAMHLTEGVGEWLLARCNDHQVPPASLCLAINEAELQANVASAVLAFMRFHRIGFRQVTGLVDGKFASRHSGGNSRFFNF